MDRGGRKPGLTTMWCDDDPAWNDRLDVLRPRGRNALLPWLLRFWWQARDRQVVVLRGTVTAREGYRDLLAAVLLRRLRTDPPLVVISDATIAPWSARLARTLGPLARLLPLLARALIRAADGPGVRWCVLSNAERDSFPATWGVPQERVFFTPFRHTLWESRADARPLPPIPRTAPATLFCGGDSLRDHTLLLDALRALAVDGTAPDRPCLIATTRLAPTPPPTPTPTPEQDRPGVVVRALDESSYQVAMRTHDVHVVPLLPAPRSAGQQTYLNGMALGAVVVVCDPLGAAGDYIEDGVTGLLVDPAPEALRAALADVLDPARAAHYAGIRHAAREVALREYSPESYRRRLLQVAGLRLIDLSAVERHGAPL